MLTSVHTYVHHMGIFQLFLEYMFKVEKYRELFVLYNSLVNFLRAFTL